MHVKILSAIHANSYTFVIGIAVKGRSIAGVIYQPYFNYQAGPDAKLGRVIYGVIGVGAFGFDRNTPPNGENIITTTRSHSNQTVLAAVDACEPTEVLRVGGAGHKVCSFSNLLDANIPFDKFLYLYLYFIIFKYYYFSVIIFKISHVFIVIFNLYRCY